MRPGPCVRGNVGYLRWPANWSPHIAQWAILSRNHDVHVDARDYGIACHHVPKIHVRMHEGIIPEAAKPFLGCGAGKPLYICLVLSIDGACHLPRPHRPAFLAECSWPRTPTDQPPATKCFHNSDRATPPASGGASI